LARKILLADDSVTAQNMGRKILADAGYDVATVNNGSAALKRVADFKPDLIVLDVYMPGYSGLEVCQRLKDSDETAQIPILLSVGKLEPFKPEEARRVGADAHIVKPFEASELLTAITRLEDLMVTQPRNGLRQAVDSGSERFRSAGNGKKSESNSAADTGWKSRLGFSSKKKKEEKEEVEDALAGTFRDFRKGKRNGAGDAKKVKQASGPEPIPVADFPGDITKDELDALSALAAKLEGSILPAQIPQAEEDAPAANDTADEKTSAAAEAPGVASGSTVVSEVAISDAAALEAAVAAPVVESAIPESSIPESPSVEVPVFTVEGNNEIEIPVEHVELQSENAAAAVETDQQAPEPAAREYAEEQPSESQPSENQLSETSVVIATTVNTAQFAQEPACVDRDDEPGFASPANATAQVMEEPKPAPSDAELVQALRLLTPANWNPDTGSGQSQESPGTSKAALREESAEKELSHRAADGPRWVAEPVALSPEEAAISLEAEMFRTFAVLPGTAPVDALEPVAITGVSAIEAAVENRLAAADLIAAAKALLEPLPGSVQEQGLQHLPSEHLTQDSAHPASAQHEPETKVARTSIAEESVVSSETPPVSPAAIMDAGQGHPSYEYPGEASRSIPREADEPPKAKAAAATAEGGESTSSPDASTIASIVDRVMADLRPKIVEEITRKLSGK
jgi:twitching motility two-component system response regulator PilH